MRHLPSCRIGFLAPLLCIVLSSCGQHSAVKPAVDPNGPSTTISEFGNARQAALSAMLERRDVDEFMRAIPLNARLVAGRVSYEPDEFSEKLKKLLSPPGKLLTFVIIPFEDDGKGQGHSITDLTRDSGNGAKDLIYFRIFEDYVKSPTGWKVVRSFLLCSNTLNVTMHESSDPFLSPPHP